MKLYTARDKKIVSIDVLLELDTKYYLRDVEELGYILPLPKDSLGMGIHKTFKDAKKERLELLRKHEIEIGKEIEYIEAQKDAEVFKVKGEVKDK